jgi:hypothetical protein
MGRHRSVINMTAVKPGSWPDCEERDSHRMPFAVDIMVDDWDLLFRAVLEVLARVSVAGTVTEGSAGRLKALPGAAMRECLDALDQLRRTVPSERCQQLTLTARDCAGMADLGCTSINGTLPMPERRAPWSKWADGLRTDTPSHNKEQFAMPQTIVSQSLDEPTRPNGNGSAANRLLAAMPDVEFQRWRPHLKLVELTLGQVISEPGRELEYAYSP